LSGGSDDAHGFDDQGKPPRPVVHLQRGGGADDRLRFAHAIRLARGLAREEHARSGRTVHVDMACSEFTITLAQYAGQATPQRAAA
jgi:hypothetical protein